MYPRESHRSNSNHHGKKQQGPKVLLFPCPTRSVPPSEIKTSQDTASEYGEQHTLEITFKNTWLQAFANKSPTQFQNQFTNLVKHTIQTQESFFDKISYFMRSLIYFSNQKRFLVNWDICQILSTGILRPTGFKVLFKQDDLTQLKCNCKYYQTIKQGSLSSIKNVFTIYQRLFKAKSVQHILKIYSKEQDTYLEQLKKSFLELHLITQESSFRKEKSKINKVLQDFMMTSFCNQFILIVTNILEILSTLHPNNKYFTYFLRFWLSEAINKSDIKEINKHLSLIHDKCIKMASQFESDQEMYKNPFGSIKKLKKVQTKTTSNKDTNSQQSKQKDKTQVSIGTKSQQSPKIYVKVYQVKHKIQKMNWVHQKYIKYIAIDRKNTNFIQYYRIQAKVKENQMNVLRYLCSIKRNYVFKYNITLDNHPENEKFQCQNPALQPQLCFEFQSRKADKDYATTRFKENFKKYISKEDLWAYRDRNIIYNFMLCFATSIIQLEANYIHHLDFSFENFIKFHQIFQVIDLEYAYVVDINNQVFQKTNRKLFEIWLQSSLHGSLSSLINSEINYRQIKEDYQNNKSTKQQAVNRCIQLMYVNMKKDHFYQFYTLCHNLLSEECLKFQGFPLSKEEVDEIRSKILEHPSNLQDFYLQFIANLKEIFERYNQKNQIIGKQQYSLTKDLQSITNPEISQETKKKTIFFTQSFQQQPLKYCFPHDQIIQKQQDVMIQSRKDHTLFTVDHIYQKQRNLELFLMYCILLLEELEQNGLLLLNLGVQSFVHSGEAFFLKNFTYLFKVGPKYLQIAFRTRSDLLLNKLSIKILSKLSILERSSLREKLFDKETLDNIYKIAYLEHKDLGCQNMPTIKRIIRFFQRNLKEIHYKQFKRLALSLLENAPKHFNKTEEMKGYVNAKNLANFYTLFEDIEGMSNIVSSY